MLARAPIIILSIVCAGLVVSNALLWTQGASQYPGSDRAQGPARVEPRPPSGAVSAEAETEAQPELAPYMTRLQGITHKLGLSLAASNLALSRFYLYESREQVSEILDAVPEYRGQPVALLAERFLEAPYKNLAAALDENRDEAQLTQRYAALVEACNACHAATQHGSIRIPATLPRDNPYLQNFATDEP